MSEEEKIKNVREEITGMEKALDAVEHALFNVKMATVEIAVKPGVSSNRGNENTLKVVMKIAGTLYKQWQMWTRGVKKMERLPNYLKRRPIFHASETAFEDLHESEKDPFIVAAIEMLKVVRYANAEHPESPQPGGGYKKVEFIQNVFPEPVYTVLNKGDYAYVHRRNPNGPK